MFLLDSDVLIWHLRNRADVVALLQDLTDEGPLMISVLTRFELLQGVWPKDRARTLELLNALEGLPVDQRTADLAGRVSRQHRDGGFAVGPVDCLISATAMIWDLTVVTFNLKDYRLPGLRVYPRMPQPA